MASHNWQTCEHLTAAESWYAETDTLKPLLQKHLQYTDSILLAAAGAAGGTAGHWLHEHLYDSGYRGLTVVHNSNQLVQVWRQRNLEANRHTMTCQVSDLSQGLPYDHCPYSTVIDKGTLDCILCRETGLQDAASALQHVWNNLKSSGTFILFSHGSPSMRMPLLKHQTWKSVVVKAIRNSPAGDSVVQGCDADEHQALGFVYVCKKPFT